MFKPGKAKSKSKKPMPPKKAKSGASMQASALERFGKY